MGSGRDNIHVLLADEQGLFREAVRIVLESQPDVEVVAEVGDEATALEAAAELEPDVALVSMALGGYSGLAAARSLSELLPDCRVVMLAPRTDMATLVDAFEAGARGYVSKQSPISDLVDAIRAVHVHGILVPQGGLPDLIRSLVGRRRDRDEATARYGKLTTREREVLGLLITGADNDTIGRSLLISPQTARTHVQNILAKLRVHSRLEAAALVRQLMWRESSEPSGAIVDASSAIVGSSSRMDNDVA
jgi:DNA-binding NarL/FixJ family response regulator